MNPKAYKFLAGKISQDARQEPDFGLQKIGLKPNFIRLRFTLVNPRDAGTSRFELFMPIALGTEIHRQIRDLAIKVVEKGKILGRASWAEFNHEIQGYIETKATELGIELPPKSAVVAQPRRKPASHPGMHHLARKGERWRFRARVRIDGVYVPADVMFPATIDSPAAAQVARNHLLTSIDTGSIKTMEDWRAAIAAAIAAAEDATLVNL